MSTKMDKNKLSFKLRFLILVFFILPVELKAETVSGILKGEQEITLKSKSQGELTTLNREEGASVKAGDLLAIIDDRQEEIERKMARIEYDAAEKDYGKTKGLHKYVSQDEIIEKKNIFLRKKSILDLKEYAFGITRVTTPITGVITKKYFDKGETVSVGDKMFEVITISKLILEINIPATTSLKLKLGEVLTFKTDFNKNIKYPALITYKSPAIDPISGTVKIKLSIDNPVGPDKNFLHKPGTLVSIELP